MVLYRYNLILFFFFFLILAYSNTELANSFLVSDAEFSVHSYIIYSNDNLWPHYNHLESAVVKGINYHHKDHGHTAEHVHVSIYL